MNMSSITRFGMKDCLSLPSLGWKHFMSSRCVDDEPIYSYTDKYMRHFVRQAIKGGKVGAFNQLYESQISDKIFNTISNNLNVNGNKYEIVEAYVKYIKEFKNKYEAEYLSNYSDYRQVKQQDKDRYINEKLTELDISKKLKALNRDDLLMAFDATSLYPSAMYDENSTYPKIETGYAFTPEMNDEIVNQFNTKTFTKSAILKIKYYNPVDTVLQHIPVKEEVNKIEVNRLRNGYIVDVLTSVDIQEIVRIGGKVIEVYEGVIYRENYKVSPFRDFIKNLFDLRLKYKSDDEFCCKTENWMKTEYDERVKDYWKLPNGEYIVQLSLDEGIDGEIDNENTMPSQLGAFILSNSKRIMNNFVEVIDGFKTNNVFYQDTDSLYIEKKHWDILNEAGFVGSNLCQGKIDYDLGGILFGLFLAPKIKYCLTINEFGVIEEHKTFKGFGDVNRLLDSKKYFEMKEGKTVSGSFPLS